MTSALVDVRNQLNKVLVELSNTTDGASSRRVVKEFRSRYTHLIRRASSALEDSALTQMASSLKRRKPAPLTDAGPDLFSTLGQAVAIEGEENGRRVRKNKSPRKLTLLEAELCLASLREDRARNEEIIDQLEFLIEIAKPYIVGGGTLEDGVAAAEDERKGREGSG